MSTNTSQLAIPGAERAESPAKALTRIIERAAFDQNFNPDKLIALYDLQDRARKEEARMAYIEAMRQFRANPPKIERTKHVNYATTQGGKVDYWHAELNKATELVAEGLRAVGIHHTWRTSEQNGRTTVTVVLTHLLGHSEDAATLSGPPDASGGKNSIQAIGSTTTYLQRYTLFAAVGVVPEGTDDDGKTEGMAENAISEYVDALKDSSTWEELRKVCKEAVEKANAANDPNAKERFRKVFEDRKREIREFKQ